MYRCCFVYTNQRARCDAPATQHTISVSTYHKPPIYSVCLCCLKSAINSGMRSMHYVIPEVGLSVATSSAINCKGLSTFCQRLLEVQFDKKSVQWRANLLPQGSPATGNIYRAVMMKVDFSFGPVQLLECPSDHCAGFKCNKRSLDFGVA